MMINRQSYLMTVSPSVLTPVQESVGIRYGNREKGVSKWILSGTGSSRNRHCDCLAPSQGLFGNEVFRNSEFVSMLGESMAR